MNVNQLSRIHLPVWGSSKRPIRRWYSGVLVRENRIERNLELHVVLDNEPLGAGSGSESNQALRTMFRRDRIVQV